MSRYIDAEWLKELYKPYQSYNGKELAVPIGAILANIDDAPSIDIVRCQDFRKSHIDGKITHYLWCAEWGRSTDTFGYCERGEREGE